MKCQSCGSENTEGKKFCSQCGVPLTASQLKQFCSNCKKEIVPGKKFCGGCGAKINEGPAVMGESKEMETPEALTTSATPKIQKAPGKPGKIKKEPNTVYHEEKKGHTGLFILLAVLAIVLAGGGGFCISRFVIAPSGETSISSQNEDTKDKKEEAQPAFEAQNEVQEAQYGTAQELSRSADYILPDSGSRYLTIEDLVSLTKEQLRIARNEIYAKHGRIFKADDLNAYFLSKSWYTGTVDPEAFTEELLNVYEKYNVRFIQEHENLMN